MYSDLNYNPETGVVTSTKRKIYTDSVGYLRIRDGKKSILLHRAIWAIVHGSVPNEIDHINHNRQDNRLANLRNCTRKDNMRNKPLLAKNISGCHGVRWEKGKWRVRISHGRNIHLGYFTDLEEAILTRKLAEKEYGYHDNHGSVQV